MISTLEEFWESLGSADGGREDSLKWVRGGGKHAPAVECLSKGRFIPTRDFQGIQVKKGSQGIQPVQVRHYIPVFNIRQTANVQNEVWAAPLDGNLVTGLLYITIRKTKGFSGLAKA